MSKYVGAVARWWRGEGEGERAFAGGAAAPVVYGKPPVLGQLRRGDGPRRVAVFLDESREAEFAFKWAAENVVDKQHDRVLLLSVATPPPFADATMPGSDVDMPLETPSETEARLREDSERARRRAEALLRVAADDGAARGIRMIETSVINGPSASLVGPLVCEAAAARDADVAVMGTRGHGVFRSILTAFGLGSTSEYAAKHLNCPVLLVKAKPPDPAAAAAAAAAAARAAERIAAAAEDKARRGAAAVDRAHR